MMLLLLKIIKDIIEDLPKLQFAIPSLEPINGALNVFAWARALLPMNVILVLLTLTASFYAFKFTFNLLKFVVSCIK